MCLEALAPLLAFLTAHKPSILSTPDLWPKLHAAKASAAAAAESTLEAALAGVELSEAERKAAGAKLRAAGDAKLASLLQARGRARAEARPGGLCWAQWSGAGVLALAGLGLHADVLAITPRPPYLRQSTLPPHPRD